MAVDWFLVLSAVVISLILLAFVSMILIYFTHPDDKNAAWLPKIVVVFALYLACANVLLLPMDVANGQSGGGLDMSIAWEIAIWTTAVMLFVIIPFAYFYYENETLEDANTAGCCGLIPNWNGQLCEGIKWSIGSLICFSLILVLMWLFLRYTDIPLKSRNYQWQSSDLRVSLNDNSPSILDCSNNDCKEKSISIKMEVTMGVFLMAMISWLGWFLFTAFAGIGLVMLPFDLYNSWAKRPVPMSLEEYASKKTGYRERATLLREAGHAIKNDELYSNGKSVSRAERQEMRDNLHRFENAVYMLKKEYIHTEMAFKLRGGNPLIPWMKLFLAVIGASMSLMWLLHICIFVLPPKPADPLLNNLFIGLTIPGFPLFGVCAFGCYVGWLLFAVMKGNFRVGIRLVCCRVFPMEYNGTLTNSFLANSWLILLCSFVVVQFSAVSFPIYARNSQVDLIFGTQARYLRFFTYFFDNHVFVYALLCFSLLGLIWQIVCPRDEAKAVDAKLAAVLKQKTVNRRQLEKA